MKERWNIGKWTGLIVYVPSPTISFIPISERVYRLASLLCIFLVECSYISLGFSLSLDANVIRIDISTSYVDRLQCYPSLPSSSDSSPSSTPTHTHALSSIEVDGEQDNDNTKNHHHNREDNELPDLTENSPLMPPREPISVTPRIQVLVRSQAIPHLHSHGPTGFFQGHHRHESRGRHEEHHRSPRIASSYTARSLAGENEHAHLHIHSHGYAFLDEDGEGGEEEPRRGREEGTEDEYTVGDNEPVAVGRKRQVAGILVRTTFLAFYLKI